MDIYEFAMQMEKDGENYYLELRDSCKTAGLQKIFSLLAEEEVKHFEYIDQLRRQADLPSNVDTPILESVKSIFVDMKEGKQVLHIDTTEETDAYRKARDLEEKSMKFYQEKAEEVQDEDAKNLLLQLVKEEEKHLRIMQSLVDFVSRPEPGNWLENAEWHHLEEY